MLSASGRECGPHHAIVGHVSGAMVKNRLRRVPQFASVDAAHGSAVARIGFNLSVVANVKGTLTGSKKVHSETDITVEIQVLVLPKTNVFLCWVDKILGD